MPTHGRRASATPGIVSERTLIADLPSLEREEVRGHLVDLLAREFHGRHEGAWLDGLWIFDPGAQRLWRVLDHPGPDRRPAHEMRQIRPEHPVGWGAAHGVPPDPCHPGQYLPPSP